MTRQRDLAHKATQLTLAVHDASFAATNLLAITAELLELAPKRGELTDKLIELVETIRACEQCWRSADEALLDAAILAWHEAHIDYTPIPMTEQLVGGE